MDNLYIRPDGNRERKKFGFAQNLFDTLSQELENVIVNYVVIHKFDSFLAKFTQ